MMQQSKEKAIEAAKKKQWPGLDKFQEHEYIYLAKYSNKTGIWSVNPYPLIGGRLRLAHEDVNNPDAEGNITLNIATEEKFIENKVLIRATVLTWKGMYSMSKLGTLDDYEKIETMAIARALRFAGYGMEFTGAEEMSSFIQKDEEVPTTESTDRPTDKPVDKPPDKIDVDKARKTIFGIASEYLIPKTKLERDCADRYAEGAKDWSMSSMTPEQWAEYAEAIVGIKSEKKTVNDWMSIVSLLYPHSVIYQVIDQLGIKSLDDISTAWKTDWDMPGVIKEAQTVVIETDYQKDCITALVAKTDWKSTDSIGFLEWLDKTAGGPGSLNYLEARRVINTLVATLRKKDVKFTLPDYTL
jgi:hypothetical protein